MLEKIVNLIVEASNQTGGQNAAARLHSVLMDVGNAVGKKIVEEQAEERAQGLVSSSSNRNACHC